MQPFGLYAPTMVVDRAILPISDYVELNGFNLANHTTALEQSVLGKPHLASAKTGLVLQPPTSLGKRSRSSSSASSSSSSSASGNSHDASVFSSFDIDGSEVAFDSQTSIGEQTPSSRKSSISSTSNSISQQQQLEQLSAWRAEMMAASQSSDTQHCAKRIRDLQGEVVRLASEVVQAASQSAPLVVPPKVVASEIASATSISPASSSTSSSSEGTKTALVDCLVDAACRTLGSIWSPSVPCDLAKGQDGLPLQVFVRETLRRGRTSCSTLQAALLYCVRLGEATKSSAHEGTISSPFLGMTKEERGLTRCPRRMFLASIITASKFVQDRCYSNRAWSKISGLAIKDLGKLERAFLKAIDYRLMVSEGDWESWTAELKRAHFSEYRDITGRRSSFNRSQSDNITGAGVAPDTELRAVSPCSASQVQPKYRLVNDNQQPQTAVDMALPFPRAHAAGVSAVL